MLLFYILPHLPMATPTTAGYGNISTNSTTQVSLSLSRDCSSPRTKSKINPNFGGCTLVHVSLKQLQNNNNNNNKRQKMYLNMRTIKASNYAWHDNTDFFWGSSVLAQISLCSTNSQLKNSPRMYHLCNWIFTSFINNFFKLKKINK